MNGATDKFVDTVSDAKIALRALYLTRIVGENDKNGLSSRSHVIVDIKLKLNGKQWKIRLGDLAGSERFPKYVPTVDKKLIDEMKHINLSLTSIGRLMNGIAKNLDFRHLMRASTLTSILFASPDFDMIFIGTISSEE